jgi:hypothetical protein
VNTVPGIRTYPFFVGIRLLHLKMFHHLNFVFGNFRKVRDQLKTKSLLMQNTH